MRIILVLILLAPAWSMAANSKANHDFPEILTSRQLLALPPTRRMVYFNQIRKMYRTLAKMHHQKKGILVSGNDRWLNLLQHLAEVGFPEAAAESCTDPNYPFDLGGLCGDLCAGRATRADETGQSVNNNYFCFRKSHWDAISPAQRANLTKYPDFGGNGSWEERAARIETARQEAIAKMKATPPAVATTNPRTQKGETLPVGSGQLGGNGRLPSEVQQGLAGGPAGHAITPKCGSLNWSKYSESCVNDEILARQESDAKKQNEDVALAKKIEATSASPESCTKPSMECQDKAKFRKGDRDKALDIFRKSAPKNCVYAGNMSTYANNDVKAGNCSKVNEFCMSSSGCENDKGVYGNDFRLKYKCDSGQILCSPFVYGLASTSRAICVGSGAYATEDCDEAAKKLEADKSSGYVKDFIGRAPTGVADVWDSYAEAFNETCRKNTKAMDAHCEECAVIGKHLKEANLLATGNCEMAVRYHERGAPATSDSTTTR